MRVACVWSPSCGKCAAVCCSSCCVVDTGVLAYAPAVSFTATPPHRTCDPFVLQVVANVRTCNCTVVVHRWTNDMLNLVTLLVALRIACDTASRCNVFVCTLN